jgi:flagellar protein FlaJ
MAKIPMNKRKVLLISILISCVLIVIGLISGDRGVLGNVLILSVFIIITPQLILNYISYKKLKEMELLFPHFLRDLVEATRAGLPFDKAIIFVSHTDYGPLSDEVKKMAHQLSWNINILRVLQQSKERLKKSNTLSRIIRVLIETYKSGGAIADTLNSLSEALMRLQETEKERKSTLSQYVIAMYVVSLMFMGVIVAINNLMIPIFEAMTASPMEGQALIENPCTICFGGGGVECSPCTIYFGICSIFGVEMTKISCYYLALFFSMSIVQAMCGGLVAGQIGEGSIVAGTKHSLILLAITFGAFFILVNLGFIG